MVDLPLVRAKLERRMSDVMQGRLTWDALEVHLFPVPRGVLKGVRIDFRGLSADESMRLNCGFVRRSCSPARSS